MAKCEICGKKLPAFSGGPRCVECENAFVTLRINSVREVVDPKQLRNARDYLTSFDGTAVVTKEVQAHLTQYMNDANKLLDVEDETAQYFQNDTYIDIAHVFYLNETKQIFAIKNNGYFQKKHEFSELLDYEVVEDGNSLIRGSAGAAAVGMILGGVSGAIIGSSMSRKTVEETSQLDIILTYKGFDSAVETIRLLNLPANKSITKTSEEYKNAFDACNRIVSALKQILNSNMDKEKELSIDTKKPEAKARAIYAFSVADEILKFKNLLDLDIITEEEFEKQKQKLLSLEY